MRNEIKVGSLVSYPSWEDGKGMIKRFGIVRQMQISSESRSVILLVMSTDGIMEMTDFSTCELYEGDTNE
tara:strand:- start:118 stop:327 length:210 start_codon:yes stop_codon:yes gene_type:complete